MLKRIKASNNLDIMMIGHHVIILFGLGIFCSCKDSTEIDMKNRAVTYYIDSDGGKDSNSGTSKDSPWQSIHKIEQIKLYPGDSLRFKRGSRYSETLYIKWSGNKDNYITLTDYGDPQSPAPAFTNPVFDKERKNFGNCIRLQGDYIILQNLYFDKTVAEISDQSAGFTTMWQLGAVYVGTNARHCIVRDNEFLDCGVAIKSNGSYAVIENNYIHDCNRILKYWGWGPIGIWIGADDQEIRYNRIFNYSAVDPRITWGPNSYGGGADGGAIEIDDARVDKSNISIHHNYSRDCQGFLEVTWTDVQQNPDYRNFEIHHNISDDYQQFVAIWRGAGFKIDNNTIIRRKVNANDWGVFNITQYDARNRIQNNIIVVEKNIRIFNLGKNGTAVPNNIIDNNLYYAASDTLNMGLEGPGTSPLFSDPALSGYASGNEPADYELTMESPAINSGLDLGYNADFVKTGIPVGNQPDIGAFEYNKN